MAKIKAFLKSRKAKKGSIAAVITAVVLAVVILVNVAAGLLVGRFPALKLDMTSSGTYQLQSDTVEYLSQLDKDINIYVLLTEESFKAGRSAYTGGEYFVQANELLKRMEAASSHVKLSYIDLSSNPTFTSKFEDVDWTSNGANNIIIVECGGEHTALEIEDCFTYDESSQYIQYGYYEYTSTTIEQAVITGVLYITSDEKIGVDFVKGSGVSENYYTPLKKLLEQNAYKVNEINLLTEEPSADSDIVVLYGPNVDLSEASVKKLEDWLDNNGERGKTLIYIPYDDKTDTPNINELVETYGMKVSEGFAFCAAYDHMVSDQYTFIADYNNDTYTEHLKNASTPVVVGYSKAVEITDKNTASPLLSVESSAGVVPFDGEEGKTFEDYLSKDGVNLAAVGAKSNDDGNESKIAIFGSPGMFSSGFLATASFNNSNYIVNFCNTVTNRGDMGITITSNSAGSTELGSITQSTATVMGIIFIGAVPATVLIIGLIVYIRRRGK